MKKDLKKDMEKQYIKEREELKMKTIKKILNWIVFLFTGKGEIGNEAVNGGLIDHSGQGRNEYGK